MHVCTYAYIYVYINSYGNRASNLNELILLIVSATLRLRVVQVCVCIVPGMALTTTPQNLSIRLGV